MTPIRIIDLTTGQNKWINRYIHTNAKGQWWVRYQRRKLPVLLNMYVEPHQYFAVVTTLPNEVIWERYHDK